VSIGSAPAIEYEYLWFNGQPVAQMSTATSEIVWYFNDHLGTPLLQTDATATVIWRVEREPYGKIAEHREGFGRHQPLAFPGQEEQGGELTYNIHRWYRSGWGRYTQADPIGFGGRDYSHQRLLKGRADSANLFGYAGDRPLTLVDPQGLQVRSEASDEFRQRQENAPCHCGNATNLLRAARSDLRDWSKAADRADANEGFGPGTNKCNLFVDAQYGWPVVGPPAQPGDLIANAKHVGIAASSTPTISATPYGVVENDWGFADISSQP
jgi:RHS repeat-associated protein